MSKKELSYNDNDALYLTLDAQVEGGDYQRDNNTAFVVFYRSAPENTQKPAVTSVPSGMSGNPTGGNAATAAPGTQTHPKKQSVTKKPGKVTGLDLTSRKRSIFVTWNWKSGIPGWQIQYARNKKFTKQKKTKTAGKYAQDKTIRWVKLKKTYYIRVWEYKKSNGKKQYGKWSKIKKVKVR